MLSELWSDLSYRARALFRRTAMEQDLNQEVEYHLQRETERHIRAGLSPEEARFKAKAEFGGEDQIKETSRDGRGLALLEEMSQNLRYALRALGRSPGFTAAVILTLALGIGANVAIFGVVDRLLFRPPPFLVDADAVNRVYLTYNFRGRDHTNSSMAYTRYLDLARDSHSFSQTAAFSQRDMPIGVGDNARELSVQTVSASYFSFFNAKPELGRFFTSAEDSIAAPANVIVISDGYWRREMGARRDVLGQILQVGTVPCTIIGVAPPGFIGLLEDAPPVVFMPITTYAANSGFGAPGEWHTIYNWDWMKMIVRRKPGITDAQANADLSDAYRRSYETEAVPTRQMPTSAVARPRALAGSVLTERGPGQGPMGKVAEWTGGVTLIVLLIACANVANLLLARAFRRRREIAVRLALGVGRARLARQLLTETVLLGVMGGTAGLLLAHWTGSVLHSLFLPPGTESTQLFDPRTLAFAAGAALLAGGLTGIAPILQIRQPRLVESLKAGAREGVNRRSRLRSGLLLTQGALSLVLLVGAGLFVKSLQKVEALPLGFDVDPVVYVQPNLRGVELSKADQIALVERLQARAAELPNVAVASRGVSIPFWSGIMSPFTVPGVDSVDRLGRFSAQIASAEYFSAMGTRILHGRGFAATDRVGTPRVIVVSQNMAQAIWPGQDPLGKCVKFGMSDTMPCTTVVGVAENIKANDFTQPMEFQYYSPMDQGGGQNAGLFIRTRGAGIEARETIRKALQPLMPGAGYVTVTPMREIVDSQLDTWRVGSTMFVVFGGLALLLAAIGLYSVIAYDVAQRTHELGVRIALGAELRDVLGLVMGDGVRFAVAGVTIGGVIALVAGRWIEPLLFHVSARDPEIFGAVILVLLGVAAVASAIPALRASRVDPNIALRSD